MGQHVRGALIAGASALLAIGSLAGLTVGGDTNPSMPTVLELSSDGVISEGGGLIKDGVKDADKAVVGTAVWDCTNAEGVAWPCRVIFSLEPGTSTAAGSIVLDGLFEGFSGESLAITGGTGAYADARGEATLSVTDDGFTWHLELAA